MPNAMPPVRRAEIEAWHAGLSSFDRRLTCCTAATDLLAELRRVEGEITRLRSTLRCDNCCSIPGEYCWDCGHPNDAIDAALAGTGDAS